MILAEQIDPALAIYHYFLAGQASIKFVMSYNYPVIINVYLVGDRSSINHWPVPDGPVSTHNSARLGFVYWPLIFGPNPVFNDPDTAELQEIVFSNRLTLSEKAGKKIDGLRCHILIDRAAV